MVLVLGAAGRHQKHAHESAFLLLKEHLKMRKGPRILALFLQALRLKALVPSWHDESCCGGLSLTPKKGRELENTRHLGLEYCWVG